VGRRCWEWPAAAEVVKSVEKLGWLRRVWLECPASRILAVNRTNQLTTHNNVPQACSNYCSLLHNQLRVDQTNLATLVWPCNCVWFGLVYCCLTTLSAQKGYRSMKLYYVGPGDNTTKRWNNTLNQENHQHYSAWALWRLSPHRDKASSGESF